MTADIDTEYAVAGDGGRIGGVVIFAPSQDGSRTAQPIGVPGSPMQVSVVGGASGGIAPADYSANAATVPMSGLVLLATIPATASRASVEVQNQSAGTVQVVRDDGNGTSGTVSSIILAGSGAGLQGGGWSSTSFKGRVRIFGASGSQIAAFQE